MRLILWETFDLHATGKMIRQKVFDFISFPSDWKANNQECCNRIAEPNGFIAGSLHDKPFKLRWIAFTIVSFSFVGVYASEVRSIEKSHWKRQLLRRSRNGRVNSEFSHCSSKHHLSILEPCQNRTIGSNVAGARVFADGTFDSIRFGASFLLLLPEIREFDLIWLKTQQQLDNRI